ncbi:isoprenylcysteine carboxylmethyltransferase family protein [Crossiella sp. CA-258035]|uniref:methyltransferase family protein n=1 Tax=Crossiella sp. CA-258035 TaxID=2981138 RepID=UPI0024BD470D|nr:isoprenylcysteine carboxylmethyltransferase family protein [Crossiella sp. CA-258035]WHT23381.1 isoprenylcysteine carboxylmethyltransferase family protein [Crossiella sp. CA-258035]
MDRATAAVGLLLYLGFVGAAFGVRAVLHRRRTGSAGFHGVSGRPGSAEWWGGVLFVVAVLLGLVAPLAQLWGLMAPLALFGGVVGSVVGGVVAVAGIVATLAAQGAMGASWRVGVDRDERTELVTGGPFRLARNPIFTAMTATAAGLTLLAPNVIALLALAALVTAIQLQVRIVEEPHLKRVHGKSYVDYGRRVGRFLPRVGRFG